MSNPFWKNFSQNVLKYGLLFGHSHIWTISITSILNKFGRTTSYDFNEKRITVTIKLIIKINMRIIFIFSFDFNFMSLSQELYSNYLQAK